jgi:hypothetical protein
MRDTDAFSLRALYAAAMRAARGKRKRASVARFLLELEPALCTLRDELLAGDWRPGLPRLLAVHDPKPRTISVAPFRDRVVHQALAAVVAPRIERRLVTDTYACRPGFGTHAALARARAWARTYRWCVHLDVAKFFPSIDHATVSGQLAADHPEPWVHTLCGIILTTSVCERRHWHFAGDDLLTPLGRAVGLPLGNLTSQLWANRYLDPVDHLIKDRLRLRPYLRYMDDMLLFHDDRATLEQLAHAVERECHALRLRLHPWQVVPTRAGVGIVGYRIGPDQVRVRRSTVARAERRLRAAAGDPEEAFRERLVATFAHWAFADTWRLRERTLERLGLRWW